MQNRKKRDFFLNIQAKQSENPQVFRLLNILFFIMGGGESRFSESDKRYDCGGDGEDLAEDSAYRSADDVVGEPCGGYKGKLCYSYDPSVVSPHNGSTHKLCDQH